MNLLIHPEKLSNFSFGRIIGGMAWPSDQPGFAVVVGEEKQPRVGGKSYHCHILAEVVEMNKFDLLNNIGDLQALYKTGAFYGRYDESNIVHLYVHNSQLAKAGKSPIEFMVAPYSQQNRIELYVDMIIRRLRPTSKSLHLGQSELAKFLQIVPEDRITATAATHPPIAALGYAIAIFDLYAPIIEEEPITEDEDQIDPITGY